MDYEQLQWAVQKLGLLSRSSQADLKREYKQLSKKHHPDLGGDAEEFAQINKAYHIVKEYMEGFRFVFDYEEFRRQYPHLGQPDWLAGKGEKK
ncbi:MAG: J domain-containing protein [Campylobacterota bacterium]